MVFAQSTSASAAADKGGQLVNIDGVEYTFAQIGGFPSEKQIQLLTQIKNPMQKIKLGGYLNEVANEKANEYTQKMEVANQTGKEIDARVQVTNKETDQAALRKQAAIDKVTAQIPQVIPLYESDVQQGKKLSQEDKSRLEYVL